MARRQVSIFINGREVANEIKSITAEKGKLVRELNRMTIGTAEYNKTAKEISQLNGIITKHRQTISGVESSWSKISAGATKFLGIAGIAFSVDAIVGYGKELFRAGVEMDTLERKARTVLGPALAFVQQKALDNATAMGLTTQQYVAQTAAIADILIPMGFQRDRAAEIATSLVDLSGALSEWTGGQKSAEEVSKILSKALTGEREQLKELGIVIQEADVSARLAEKGLDKLTGTMLQQAKAAATLELITEKSVDAQTAYAENSDSLIRKQAELKAKITDISQGLAVTLIPVFEKLVAVAGDVAGFFGSVVDGISDMINPAEAATKAFNEQQSAVASLEEDLNPLLKRYDELTSKSSLSTEEQKELEAVMAQIGEIVPTAITQFGEYGQVLGISTEKVQEFVAAQKLLLTQKNREAIEENTDALDDFKTRVEEIQKALRNRDAEGDIVRLTTSFKRFGGEFEAVTKNVKLSADEITNLRGELQKLEADIKTREAAINLLSGNLPEAEKATSTSDPAADEAALKAAAAAAEAAKAAAKEAEKARKKKIADDKKAAEDEKKAIEDSLRELTEITEKFRQEEQLAQLSADAQALERIRQKYADEIALAKELEAKGVTDATAQRLELERIRDNEISALKLEQANKSLEADLAAEEVKDQALIDQHLEFINAKRDAENLIAEELRTELDQAVLDMQLYYAELIALAEKYGLDVTALKEKEADEIAKIEKKFKDDAEKKDKEAIQSKLDTYVKLFGALADVAAAALDLVGEKSVEFAALSKLLALAEIGFKTGVAIASGIASAQGVGFPGNLIAMATTIATVLTNIKTARDIVNNTQVPQKKFGGYFDVTGADDHQSYRAQYIGSPQSGMLPSHPVVLASEGGPEYFVSNKSLEKPAIANYVRMIDNIEHGRVAQFAKGGAAQNGEAVALPATLSAGTENAALTNELRRLNNILERGIFALVDDDEVINIFKKFNSINEASGGTIGG